MSIEKLFSKFDSHSALAHLKESLQTNLRNIAESDLKRTSTEDWVKHFTEKYTVRIPSILRTDIEGDVQDAQLNARHFRSNFHFDDHDDNFIPTPGTEVRFYVPFQGDPDYFNCSGNTLYATFPRALLTGSKLTLTYQTVDHDVNTINNNFDRDLTTIEAHLRTLEIAFQEFNNLIEPTVREYVNQRLAKFAKDSEMASKLKYPLKRRDGAPLTYKVAEIKRCASPRPLPKANAATQPDPTLEMEHYDHILTIVKNMVRVMECSPKAFKEIDEENLRFHFLVQLNAQYEGMATGETFNFHGKTDIIIKYQNQNLFICECKFWKGPKAYIETIDQVLRYTTWRDTKTSILIFCKDVDPSVPIAKISDETMKHPSYIKSVSYGDESSFRFIFKHPGDSTKELILTVIVFNIPK